MKTLTNIRPRSHHSEHSAAPRNPKLVGQWQRGIETIPGHAQWKLHLTFARSPSPRVVSLCRVDSLPACPRPLVMPPFTCAQE
jgi:hypothetical protein